MAKNGFSLIELLIVVLILGILAMLAIPRFQEASNRAKYKQVDLQMNAINKALQAFHAEHGAYPRDVTSGVAPNGLVPQFLDEWPSTERDPFGAQYDYEAWPVDDGYWIGVTYFGKNQVRDTGLHASCWYVTHPSNGIPIKEKDDVGIEVARDAAIVNF